MKKRTIITTEKHEVWVIHNSHQPIERAPDPEAATDLLNGVPSPKTEEAEIEELTPKEELESEQ